MGDSLASPPLHVLPTNLTHFLPFLSFSPSPPPLPSGSMACPALPLCGLAVTEAERGLPDVNLRLRALLTKVGLAQDESFVVRMTGCPNGCARPYMAEIGFVGDGPNSYQIYLGGNPNQTRLGELYADRVKLKDIETFFEPIFAHFKETK